MTKILYLCETLGIGGAEQLILTTLKYLNRNKFYPVVYCIGENGEIGNAIKEIGIQVTPLNRRCYLWNIEIFRDLVQIFKREKPKILHCHLFYPSYFGRIAAIFAKVPTVIITEHGTYSNFKKFYHHWIDFMLASFTTKIIAVSNAVRKYLLSHTLIPPHKITVIYNAVDFDRFDKAYGMDKFLVRQNFGFLNSDFIIGCVSNLAPWKGQLSLLQAFVEVTKAFPQARLCIVGRNNCGFRGQLEAFAQRKGFGESVYFLGERRDVPELMRAFDIFVFPSLTEGLGISLLEAMYMEIPAVASNTEGIAEIIENNKDGVLVPAEDSQTLARETLILLKDKEKMKRIASNARLKVKDFFSPQIHIKRLESLYNELVERR